MTTKITNLIENKTKLTSSVNNHYIVILIVDPSSPVERVLDCWIVTFFKLLLAKLVADCRLANRLESQNCYLP